MKKLFYIVLILVTLMVIGQLLNRKVKPTTENNSATEFQANIETQPIIKEDADGNMTVDGEIVEEIEETDPTKTSNEEETILNK